MPGRRLRLAVPSVAVLLVLGVSSQLGSAGYSVRQGDTLTSVAKSLGTSVAALAKANHIANPDRIYVGQVLTLPPGARGAGDPPPPPPPPPASPPLPLVDGPVAVYPPGSAPLISATPAQVLHSHPERKALIPAFDAAARRLQVPVDLVKAIAWQESGWQNDVVSSANARGIGQLMPDTVTFVNLLTNQHLDPTKPKDNITLEATFLAFLLYQTNGDAKTAVGAYYEGLAAMQKRGMYDDTKAYVANVLALRGQFAHL